MSNNTGVGINEEALLFEPEEGYSYSNADYAILSAIVLGEDYIMPGKLNVVKVN